MFWTTFATARERSRQRLGCSFCQSQSSVYSELASICLTLCLFLLAGHALASGTWTALANSPPAGVNNCLLLSDGTVLGMNGNGGCVRLTPDSAGSYINGTWTTLPSMNYSRLFCSSDVLTNGLVYVAGGEYGGGPSELYDPLANTWTVIQPPSQSYSDAASKLLPSGNVLQSDSQSSWLIYNAGLNAIQSGGSCEDMNETCWVRLTNDVVLAVTGYSTTSEHFVPSLNGWYTDNNVPVDVFGFGGELGPAFVLPNGNVFQVGATTNTAIYTSGATVTSAGSWVAGPTMVVGTNLLGAVDAPGAMMVNGNLLLCLGPIGGFNAPCYFLEYNYITNSFTQVSAPGGGSTYGGSSPFGTSMLCLPDGSVLFVGGQNSTSLYIYVPDAPPLPAGQPTISGVTENADGSYHLSGVGLAGYSAGAAYGDDEQMDSNYPLVRMTNNATHNVYYARTHHWTSTTIQSALPMSTEFTLPQGLPAGTYSLVVSANGNPSAPRTFIYSPPSAPTGLTAASGSNTFVTVRWNASSGATSYNLKRSTSLTGYYASIATLNGLSFTNFSLTNGLEYFYKVAAIGPNGPSSDSSVVGATPAGPPVIPGATNVNLSPYYNRTGIYTDGRTFSAGFDNGSSAYSALLLEPSVAWNSLVFTFGPSNAADVVSCAIQTIPLPSGHFNSLQILASGVNGSQQNQTFTVTYSDSSTSTFTQSFSDWANDQSYPGEINVVKMPYRVTSTGGKQTLKMTVDGYVFTLDQTKTVQSVTLPGNANLVLLSMMLANDPVPVSLSNYWNRAGIYTDGTTFTNPATGGIDGTGTAYSSDLLGTWQTGSNAFFLLPPPNQTNVVSCASQVVSLPAGNYSRLCLLAAGMNGNRTSQSFLVTYTDSTTATFVQSLSDWFTPQNYAGEIKAVVMSHRDKSDGSTDGRTFNLYGYSFPLNPAKTLQSIQLPNNNNVIVTAVSLVPNWQPTFGISPLTLASDNAGHAYSGTIATNANDLNGDSLTFAKVSGPAWLNVTPSGSLSGTPANSNANTNTFIVSVKDTGGLSNTATLLIYVNGAPSFAVNPFAPPPVIAGQSYSGTIATNATDPNPGDALTFAKISGPAWLSVAGNGGLSGTPVSSDVGASNYVVQVSDPGGLSGTATMYISVNPAPPILPLLSQQGGSLWLNWSGGIAPYQVQSSTDLVFGTWQTVGTITSNSFSISPTNPASYYRVVGN